MSRIRTVNLSQASRWQGRRAVCADEAAGREGKAEDGLSTVYSASSLERERQESGHHEKVADGMRVASGVATGQERDRQGEEGTF